MQNVIKKCTLLGWVLSVRIQIIFVLLVIYVVVVEVTRLLLILGVVGIRERIYQKNIKIRNIEELNLVVNISLKIIAKFAIIFMYFLKIIDYLSIL